MHAGFAGYTAYAPSKYALRGLADCLRNEVLPSALMMTVFSGLCCTDMTVHIVLNKCLPQPLPVFSTAVRHSTEDNSKRHRYATASDGVYAHGYRSSCQDILMQTQGSGVSVSIGFPADMDTECYKQESLIKVASTVAPADT